MYTACTIECSLQRQSLPKKAPATGRHTHGYALTASMHNARQSAQMSIQGGREAAHPRPSCWLHPRLCRHLHGNVCGTDVEQSTQGNSIHCHMHSTGASTDWSGPKTAVRIKIACRGVMLYNTAAKAATYHQCQGRLPHALPAARMPPCHLQDTEVDGTRMRQP